MRMVKKFIPLIMILMLAGAGCETAKGFGRDVKNTAENIPKAWQSLKQADDWMQENMW